MPVPDPLDSPDSPTAGGCIANDWALSCSCGLAVTAVCALTELLVAIPLGFVRVLLEVLESAPANWLELLDAADPLLARLPTCWELRAAAAASRIAGEDRVEPDSDEASRSRGLLIGLAIGKL